MKIIKYYVNKKLLLVFLIVNLIATFMNFGFADTLEKIKKTKIITLGVTEGSGIGFSLGNGKYIGFHPDICLNIIEDLKKELDLSNLEVRYQVTTPQNSVPLVVSGLTDLTCSDTTNTKARQEQVSFANTTFVEQVKISVKKDSNIKDIKDLNGKVVATSTGSTAILYLRQIQKDKNIRFKVLQSRDASDSFLLLENGRADAYITDASIIVMNISRSKNPNNYKFVGEPLASEPIAIMYSKNDKKFGDLVNKSITRQYKDGTLNKLWNKWFLEPIPPANLPLNLELSEATFNAWKNPNNNPTEDYK